MWFVAMATLGVHKLTMGKRELAFISVLQLLQVILLFIETSSKLLITETGINLGRVLNSSMYNSP